MESNLTLKNVAINSSPSLNLEHFTSEFHFHVKDPGSALTHFIAFVAAIFLTPVLLVHVALTGANFMTLTSLSVFMISMILLYGASSAYHTFNLSEHGNKVLKKIDHMMIFVLIAGSYTPVCLVVIGGTIGKTLLLLVWSIALVGMIFKMCWVTCPKWVSSVIYIGMGWVCLLAFPQIISSLPTTGFLWLLVGGIIYTVGGVIYALKFPVFGGKFRYFGSHELFHVFVMVGNLCHFVMMYYYMPQFM